MIDPNIAQKIIEHAYEQRRLIIYRKLKFWLSFYFMLLSFLVLETAAFIFHFFKSRLHLIFYAAIRDGVLFGEKVVYYFEALMERFPFEIFFLILLTFLFISFSSKRFKLFESQLNLVLIQKEL
ncbi:hypothetical protein [Carboxydothermus ferrireducens]|uniref:Uncharacterized protein n=1 Tax=Carboxydothermus ferrireducens DSM 11255 TaxID=1119529 RepID=A0ABX2RCC7_9THEO|nr:hypothetical protein [Carboxydothermus ferrireducens]NYE58580.1 hypothetical protein [Carboxydothermus ferrireducens DSM 11255]